MSEDLYFGWDDEIERARGGFEYMERMGSPIPQRTDAAPREITHPWLKKRQRNQGRRPSCVGFGTFHIFLTCSFLSSEGESPPEWSPAFLWAGSQAVDGRIDVNEGATISAAITVATRYGVCREETLPYDVRTDYAKLQNTEVAEIAIKEAAPFKAYHHCWVRGYDDTLAALQAGLVIVCGWRWTPNFANAYKTGGVVRDLGRGSLGGHCTGIYGYLANGNLLGVNSHPNNEFYQIEPRVIDQLAQERSTATCGISDQQALAPRDFTFLGSLGADY